MMSCVDTWEQDSPLSDGEGQRCLRTSFAICGVFWGSTCSGLVRKDEAERVLARNPRCVSSGSDRNGVLFLEGVLKCSLVYWWRISLMSFLLSTILLAG